MKIIITGASRGIGFDTALELSKNEHYQILALSRNIDKLKELASKAHHNNIKILSFDITGSSFDELTSFLKDWNSVDVLINNAGFLLNKPFSEMGMSEWQTLFNINFFGVVQLIQTVLPKLEASEKAHIVNIGSMDDFISKSPCFQTSIISYYAE